MQHTEEELERLRKQWYMNDDVAYQLIDNMKSRESVFLATARRCTHRCLKINAVRFLFKNMQRYEFFSPENKFNLYSSIAHFPYLPMFSFNNKEKDEQQSRFNLNYEELIQGYDLFIDFDNPDLKAVYASTATIKAQFDSMKIPYHITFSGSKGFHLCVGFENLPKKVKSLDYGKISMLFKIFVYELKLTNRCRDIDTSIFDLRRIRKVPYSVSYPYYNICYPLSDDEFEHFDVSRYYLPTMIQKFAEEPSIVHRRGLLVRQGDPESLMNLMTATAEKRKYTRKLFKIMGIPRITLIGLLCDYGLLDE